MIKKQAVISALLLPMLITAGCSMGNQGEGKRNHDRTQNVNYRNTPNDGATNMNTVNRHNQNTTDHNNNRNLRVADKAADKVTDLKEVKNATVIVAGNSAYVAVVLTNGQKGAIANHLKQKITDKVKSADKHVRTVYVSANPDFVERMQGYGKRIKNGHPVSGLFDEFGQMVQRVFPNPNK
ncbi:YhcN/YlaJ family sporulation lipoprotein [Bacillus sp. L381]|uniref:YhcN/YlaJ family sporulation lipoprotein n=1 Tax=Bacillus TaxID=1386 RepID=UPI00082413F0|nr:MULTISPECIES: YhcN/YlaJ family sporulation lipoprotein [Bacillus]AOC90368.1 Lipoprotein YhcN [Bacillus amyloliquefaciens]MCR9037486.1 YhcN/YlaJ family sporulation lipoprotein [Bacillus velezensis]QUN10413.1 YhcN/YlaJ family sporulation lipoprotein [Bacillus amyloliquefaciens]QYM83546.1 YhcN/YlaJ family sporulation lipoprotein [Bacillus sp. 7D3]QZY12729.1 YhcN/YlaJ family sporulation lipoprotein [Bacillus amyloliquefaciens]